MSSNAQHPKTLQELFTDKSKWTKYARARNKTGLETYPTSTDAVSFCLLGGVDLVYDDKPDQDVIESLHETKRKLFPSCDYLGLVDFNDKFATFDQIKRLVKAANV